MQEILAKYMIEWKVPEIFASWTASLSIIFLILIISFLSNFISKKILLATLRKIIQKSSNQWDDILLKRGLFSKISLLVPALIIHSTAVIPFPQNDLFTVWMRKLTLVYMVFISVRILNAFLNGTLDIYQRYEISKNRPIKSYIQVLKLILFIPATLYMIATMMDQSPWALLSGIGAMTAVVLLVFKDAILGFVASIQLAANDMVRPGDWIELPKYGADGSVIDLSLTTIKVQNWDMTITTVPSYALISDSFKNWRGMSESNGRRIKRSLSLDMNSIHFLEDSKIQELKKFDLLKDYLNKKEDEIEKNNSQLFANPKINGRRLTNVGTFRAYVLEYLKAHPMINKDMTLLVRQLASNEQGLPLEIYVFSTDKVWANYENIQSDLFDHFLAILPEFDLRIFQNPTGHDLNTLLHQRD